MKKSFSFTPLLLVFIYAGEIKDTLHKISLEPDQNTRIKKKLDLIIAQYIKDEEMAEHRKEVVDAAIDKTKEGIHKGADWLKEKANKMFEEQCTFRPSIATKKCFKKLSINNKKFCEIDTIK